MRVSKNHQLVRNMFLNALYFEAKDDDAERRECKVHFKFARVQGDHSCRGLAKYVQGRLGEYYSRRELRYRIGRF